MVSRFEGAEPSLRPRGYKTRKNALLPLEGIDAI